MKIDTNRKQPVPYEMSLWYAWYPVMTEKGIIVWLENVLRGYDSGGTAYYQLP